MSNPNHYTRSMKAETVHQEYNTKLESETQEYNKKYMANMGGGARDSEAERRQATVKFLSG